MGRINNGINAAQKAIEKKLYGIYTEEELVGINEIINNGIKEGKSEGVILDKLTNNLIEIELKKYSNDFAIIQSERVLKQIKKLLKNTKNKDITQDDIIKQINDYLKSQGILESVIQSIQTALHNIVNNLHVGFNLIDSRFVLQIRDKKNKRDQVYEGPENLDIGMRHLISLGMTEKQAINAIEQANNGENIGIDLKDLYKKCKEQMENFRLNFMKEQKERIKSSQHSHIEYLIRSFLDKKKENKEESNDNYNYNVLDTGKYIFRIFIDGKTREIITANGINILARYYGLRLKESKTNPNNTSNSATEFRAELKILPNSNPSSQQNPLIQGTLGESKGLATPEEPGALGE